MLIDGGNAADSNLMYTYLKKQGITHLDYVIGTHAHEDHIGGIAGAYLVLKEAKNEVEACEQAAKDVCECGMYGDAYDFDACEECMGDCDDCMSGEPECEITIEEYIEEEPVVIEIAEAVEDAVEEIAEDTVDVVAEEPAEDIFTETVQA